MSSRPFPTNIHFDGRLLYHALEQMTDVMVFGIFNTINMLG